MNTSYHFSSDAGALYIFLTRQSPLAGLLGVAE